MLGENNQKIHEEIERSRNQATLLQERIRQSCQSQQRLEERQNQTKEELKISLADGEELKEKLRLLIILQINWNLPCKKKIQVYKK